MPIVSADLIAFAAANMPEDDASTTGGAISSTGKVEITDIAATDNVEVLSDGADTRNITVTGRIASGAIVAETISLTGTTPVTSTNQFERIEKCVLSGTDASRTVTVRRATGDTLICTIGPTLLSQRRLFYDSSSDPSSGKIRREKFFVKNSHGSISLTGATITLTTDPANRYRIGCAPSVGDSATTANRLATPSSVTFVDDSVAQSIPGGTLASGASIGIWVEQNLPSADPPHKSSITYRIDGSTT